MSLLSQQASLGKIGLKKGENNKRYTVIQDKSKRLLESPGLGKEKKPSKRIMKEKTHL